MGQMAFEYQVNERLRGKKYLQPLFSGGVFDVARRLREYDPALFLVFNIRWQKFEIHSLANKGNTFAADVPWNTLDARVVDIVRGGDIRTRGIKKIIEEIDRHNEMLEASYERKRQNDLLGIAEEMHPMVRDAAWGKV